jgi:glutathione peroxidase
MLTLLKSFLKGSAGLFPAHQNPAADTSVLGDHTFPRLQDGVPQALSQYQGKVILVVNTASQCGFTGQYAALEAVYDKYKARGLVVIGFPSSDFGDQEPGSNAEIAAFCRLNYGVEFPMMAKTAIAAPQTNAFYKELIARSVTRQKWNFHKYLIDRSGTRVESFSTLTSPKNPSLLAHIERLLEADSAAPAQAARKPS